MDVIEIDSTSSSGSDSDDDIEVGYLKPIESGTTFRAPDQSSAVAEHRILPLSFTNGRAPPVGPATSGSSSSFSASTDHNRSNSETTKQRVLPQSLMGSSSTKSIGGVSQTRYSVGPTDRTKQVQQNGSYGNGKFSNEFGATGPYVSSNILRPSLESNEDDIQIIGNNNNNSTSTSSSYRILPHSMGYRSSTMNGVDLTGGPDMQNRAVLDDRRADCDERVIYQEALQNLGQPKLEDDLPEGILSVPLLKHQKIALAWMVQKEKSSHCAGGILADDQGLGKTISMIALIQKQMSEQSNFASENSKNGIINPEALNLDDEEDPEKPDQPVQKTEKLENEPSRTAASSSSSRGSHMTRPPAGTLVVCPASVLKQWANELSDKVTDVGKLSVLVYHGGARTKNPAELAKYDVVLTTYTIVTNEVPKQSLQHANDEENENKNENKSENKYGLTPDFDPSKKRKPSSSQNKGNNKKKKGKKNKDSDLDYLESGPLARVRWFRVVLDEAQTIKNHRTQVARACSGLRAKRRWCMSGTPIQNAIDDLYSYFRFLKYDPYSVYSSFCAAIKHPISRNSSHGYKKLQAVLKTVLLRRTKDTLINGEPIIKLPPKTICLSKVEFSPEERAFYLRLEERSRQQFKAYHAAGTLKQNYANILLLLLRLRQACDHPFLAQGYQSDTAGTDSFEIARNLPRELIVDLLNKLEGSSAICAICSDPPEDAVVTMCGHVYCYQCVHERLTTDETTCPASGCRETLSTESVFSRPTLSHCIAGPAAGPSSSGSITGRDDPGSSISSSDYVSSKIRAAVDILGSVCCEDSDTGPAKAIVFSQWTSMLNLMELSLNQCLMQYRRLDGTMTLVARDRAVKDFNTDPEVRVMLMSLKAGNLGLNMMAACHVILLDLWWNPYAEDQAVDRAHRIGQTRPVTVSRLTIQDTVEDRILALQEEKRNMVSSAFGEDKGGGHATRLTVEDLRYLFMV